jgi:hypothetical protein
VPDRHALFQVTCPANTPKATPVEVITTWPPGELLSIEVHIPAGHGGKTGIQIAAAHQPLIPDTPGAWIVGNNLTRHYATRKFPNTGAWSAWLYNTDLSAHYWQITFDIDEIVEGAHYPRTFTQPIPVHHIHEHARKLAAHK